MAIDAYVGLPGSGKSHGVVLSVIIPALKAGRRVVHNMPLIEEGIRKLVQTGELVPVPHGMSSAEFTAWFREHHRGALLVLDEAWRYWASGTKASTIAESERSLFAEHRHLVGQTEDGRSTDIALVSQSLSQLARFVVDLVDQTFHYNKHTQLGFSKRYRCDVYTGPVTGPKPPISKRTNSYQGKYRPEIYACYKSHTLSTTGMAGVEQKVDDRGNMLKSWRVRIAVLCLVLIPVGLWFAIHAFRALAPKPKEHQIQAGETVPVARSATGTVPPASPQAAPVATVVESTTWRISGFIQTTWGNFVVLNSRVAGRLVPQRFCDRDEARQWSCILDGELITEWTGSVPDNAVSAFVTAAATPDSLRDQ